MVQRNESAPQSHGEHDEAVFLRDRGGHAPRQRSARNDRSMRDGDGSHGNPYESDTEDDELSADNDIGDTDNAAAEEATSGAGIDGYEISDDTPAHVDARIIGTSRSGEVPPTTGDEGEPDESVAAAEYEDHGDPRMEREQRPATARDQAADTAAGGEESGAGRPLPIPDYGSLSVNAILRKLRNLTADDVVSLRDCEATHRNRKSLMSRLESRIGPRGSARRGTAEHGSKS